MDLDRQLFEEYLEDSGKLPALRVYRMSEPGISVGRSWQRTKKPGTVLEGQVCVRPTGGGLVHHGNDLLYSVIARRDTFPTFHQVRTSYLSFHEAIQGALQSLGIETRLFRCDEAKKRGQAAFSLSDCFRDPIATDLLFHEKKIAGAAQWRRGNAFLHQGSIQLVEGVSFENFKGAFLGAFERHFGAFWSKMAEVG